ncbi:transmembrane protein 255B isoform X2 [Mustela putorius furo]|uniref:Transmembrane protein 255B isoform X2 n=1 Tax=Mustela putorius furo TaxID=9669 RepID=A0A8U0S751_MUSPF|nr:transmembrane protein 255B isoform X2 [Mustela putorius furo]
MQPLAPGPLALLDTTGFARRKKDALWSVGSLLVVSAAILTVGLAATTRTENVTMGGYYPGIILGFGAFLGITGLNLVENRKQMEPRPLTAGRCQFFASEVGYVPDAHQTEVTCHSSSGACPLKVKSSSCYCCELYRCQRAPSHLLRVRGRALLPGCAAPVPAALGLRGAERAGCAPGCPHGSCPGSLQGHGPPVPAGLRPLCSTSDPLRPCPADPGLRGLLPGTCGPPHLLDLPSASPGRPSVTQGKPGRSHHGRRSPPTALVRWDTNGSSVGRRGAPRPPLPQSGYRVAERGAWGRWRHAWQTSPDLSTFQAFAACGPGVCRCPDREPFLTRVWVPRKFASEAWPGAWGL